MKKGHTYNKVFIAVLLVFLGQIAFGTGITEKASRSNFSLKNLNKPKSFSLNNMKGNYQFKNSQVLNYQKAPNNTLQVNTVIRYQSGNTTFVFPYKYKVKAPLFKTPSKNGIN